MKWYWAIMAILSIVVYLMGIFGVIVLSEAQETRCLIWIIGSLLGMNYYIKDKEEKK